MPPLPLSVDNTPDIVVKSLLEGGAAIRHVTHRHVLPLLAAHVSDSEEPMLLYPKMALGTLKGVLLKARDPQSGVLVREGGRKKGGGIEGERGREGGKQKEGMRIIWLTN